MIATGVGENDSSYVDDFQPASEKTGDCDVNAWILMRVRSNFQPASEKTGDCDSKMEFYVAVYELSACLRKNR